MTKFKARIAGMRLFPPYISGDRGFFSMGWRQWEFVCVLVRAYTAHLTAQPINQRLLAQVLLKKLSHKMKNTITVVNLLSKKKKKKSVEGEKNVWA